MPNSCQSEACHTCSVILRILFFRIIFWGGRGGGGWGGGYTGTYTYCVLGWN